MTSRVALVMAPLLPRIRTGVGNMGLENGGGFQGGGEVQETKIKKMGHCKSVTILSFVTIRHCYCFKSAREMSQEKSDLGSLK